MRTIRRAVDGDLVALLPEADKDLLGQVFCCGTGSREPLDGGAYMRIVGLKQFFEHRLVISL